MSVYLVGAGPGDSGLLTLRGYELLRRADVVVYDRLVGAGVLAMIPEGALVIDVGKSSGSHTLEQREIESLMIRHAKAGRCVVRLKGGDPFVFGRGGEEAEALIREGIDFEVVPGVSSAMAVPSCAGIPVTHRDFCSGVSIFTAHDKHNLVPTFENTTSIFLMGVGHSHELQARLLEFMSPETPCAIIEKGTSSRQREFRTTIAGLHETVTQNHVTPPAVIVVGRVASLTLSSRKPLRHKRIIITRPEGRADELASLLRDSGAEVLLMPTIKCSVIHGSLDGVSLSSYDWAAFTSVTGVNAFMELLRESGRDVRELGCARIAAVGEATRDALLAHGLRVEFMPPVYDVEHMTEGLSGRAIIFRAEGAANTGKGFTEICIYRTDYVESKLIPDYADIIIFTSRSTVRGFAHNVKGMRDAKAVCIGTQTAEEARRLGFTDIAIAPRATVMGLFEAVGKITMEVDSYA